MAAPSVPEPAVETRTRRWVLFSFLFFYACVAPLWYATSRVKRETLPDLDADIAQAVSAHCRGAERIDGRRADATMGTHH